MQTQFITSDTVTRTRSLWHPQSDGGVVIESQQDVEQVIRDNQRLFNQHDERARFKEEFVHVACIPNVILMDLHRRGISSDPQAFTRWLDDRDNRAFRTRPGKLSK